MPDKHPLKFSEETHQRHLKQMFMQSMAPSPLLQMMPKPAPLTRTQSLRSSIRWKIEAARLRVGSWIAGVDLDER